MAKRIEKFDPNHVEQQPHLYFRRKYVWALPIRLFHWVNAGVITVLFATGLYIANPTLIPAGEAFDNLVMGRVRQIHFACAFIMVIAFLWRAYWFYFGSNYARSGFPAVWDRRWWRDLFRQMMDYLKLERGHIHLGHNALAGLSYTIFVILLGWTQIFTGFAMYSESDPSGIAGSLFGWVLVFLGGSFQTHQWHHLSAWGFLTFTILHIYIVSYDGSQYKNGLVTSMVSGVKFYQEGDIDNDSWIS